MHPSTKTIITGASAGIGRELAVQLSAVGHQITGVARRKERLTELEKTLPEFSGLALDLKKSTDRKKMVANYVKKNGVPDYLILNAGLAHYGRINKISPAQLQEQIDLNYISVLDTVQQFLPHFLEAGRGRIIIVSSVLGLGTIPYSAVYSSTKHAVNGFIKGLRIELKGTGVTATAFCPAGVKTEFGAIATGRGVDRSTGEEPVERVVMGMVKQLDKNKPFVFPTWRAGLAGRMFMHFPRFMEWVMAKLVLPKIQENLDRGRY